MNMSAAVSNSAQEESKVNVSQDEKSSSEISSQGWVNDLVDVLDHVSEPEVLPE